MPASDEPTAILPGLSPICGRAIEARFDGALISSDGGLLVLREVEQRLGTAQRLAACIREAKGPAPPAALDPELADLRLRADPVVSHAHLSRGAHPCQALQHSSVPMRLRHRPPGKLGRGVRSYGASGEEMTPSPG